MRQNNKRAFTLVEVLIVIVIIGILFIVLMANVDFSTDEAKETGTKAIMQSYKLAAETIALENSGFTNDKAELVKVLNKRLDLELQLYVEGGEIKSKQTDSWGKEFKFMQSTPVNTYGMFAVQSAGPDGLFDNGDDIIMENKYVVVNGVGQVVTEFPEIDPNHSHSYVLRVTEPLFLKSPATCTSAAVYYYSCDCGKMNGTEFDFGVPNPEAHGTLIKKPVKKVPIDYAVHRTDSTCPLCLTVLSSTENPHRPDATGEHCVDCGEQLHIHIYDKEIEANQYKKNDANCTEPLTYYKSCECGAASPDETFSKGTALGHNYTKETLTYKNSDATCKDYATYFLVCYGCDGKGPGTYPYIEGGKNPSRHVDGTRIEYTWVDDLRHIKDTICNGCGAKLSSITEPHVADGECCHTHSYTKTVEATAYEHTALTCTSKAVYYKSCECGKSSEGATNETFEGSATPTHLPATTPTWNSDHSVAIISCTRGRCSEKWTSSVVNQITTTTATCVTERQYKHRATINVDGTSKTFDCTGHTGTTNASNHLRDPEYPKIESICKWYPCCETVIDDTHNWNVSAASCLTAKLCLDCGFIGEEKPDHNGTLVFANIAGVCQKYSGCGCTYSDHDLGGAACTTAATCKRSGCSYSSGEAAGHLVNTNNAIWNSDHSSVKFICSRSGCSSSWDLSTTEKVTTTANCVTAKQYKHTLTVSISGKVTISGNTSLECSGHTGSVNPSTHASGCNLTPLSPGTEDKCQQYSLCKITTSNHSYNVSQASCTVAKKCTICNYVKANATGHSKVNGGTEFIHKKCNNCGITMEDESYHSFTKTSTGTSCEDPATYRCSCGYTYVDNGGGHDWKTIPPTCTSDGSRTCGNCNKSEVIPYLGHSFQTSGTPNWDNNCKPYYICQRNNCSEKEYKTVTTETTTTATCITQRKYKHKVTISGSTYSCSGHTGDFDKTNHAQSYTNYVGPEGTGTINICQYYPCCDEIYSSTHNPNVSSASCTVPKKCTICDYVIEEETGHGTAVWGGTKYVHTKCSKCGDTISSTHSYSSATCELPAECECGYSSGGSLGHCYDCSTGNHKGTLKTAAKCESPAVYYLKCCRCSNPSNQTDTFGTAPGHSYTNNCDATCNNNGCSETREPPHYPGSAATCTNPQTCTKCNATIVPALQHNLSQSSSATCTEGKKETCSRCHATFTTGDPLGHNLSASWQHDDSTVTVSCTRCRKQASTSSISVENSPAATCTTRGNYHHTVEASLDDNVDESFTCPTNHISDALGHSMGSDDNNCTTAIKCGRGCGTTMVDGNASHNFSSSCLNKTCQNANCTVTNPSPPHVYTATCDNTCNVSGCSGTRLKVNCKSTAASEPTASKCKECTYCGKTMDSSHAYDNTCDKWCNDCSYNRGSSYDHDLEFQEQTSRFHKKVCTKCGTEYKNIEHDMKYTYTPKGWGWSNCHFVDGTCNDCTYTYSNHEDAIDCTDNGSGRCKYCNQLC